MLLYTLELVISTDESDVFRNITEIDFWIVRPFARGALEYRIKLKAIAVG